MEELLALTNELKSEDGETRLKAWSRALGLVQDRETPEYEYLSSLKGYFLDLLRSDNLNLRLRAWEMSAALIRRDLLTMDDLKAFKGYFIDLLRCEDKDLRLRAWQDARRSLEKGNIVLKFIGDLLTEDDVKAVKGYFLDLLKSEDENEERRARAWSFALFDLLSWDREIIKSEQELRELKDHFLGLLKSGNQRLRAEAWAEAATRGLSASVITLQELRSLKDYALELFKSENYDVRLNAWSFLRKYLYKARLITADDISGVKDSLLEMLGDSKTRFNALSILEDLIVQGILKDEDLRSLKEQVVKLLMLLLDSSEYIAEFRARQVLGLLKTMLDKGALTEEELKAIEGAVENRLLKLLKSRNSKTKEKALSILGALVASGAALSDETLRTLFDLFVARGELMGYVERVIDVAVEKSELSVSSLKPVLFKLLESEDNNTGYHIRAKAWIWTSKLLERGLIRPEELRRYKAYLLKLLRASALSNQVEPFVMLEFLEVLARLYKAKVVTAEELSDIKAGLFNAIRSRGLKTKVRALYYVGLLLEEDVVTAEELRGLKDDFLEVLLNSLLDPRASKIIESFTGDIFLFEDVVLNNMVPKLLKKGIVTAEELKEHLFRILKSGSWQSAMSALSKDEEEAAARLAKLFRYFLYKNITNVGELAREVLKVMESGSDASRRIALAAINELSVDRYGVELLRELKAYMLRELGSGPEHGGSSWYIWKLIDELAKPGGGQDTESVIEEIFSEEDRRYLRELLKSENMRARADAWSHVDVLLKAKVITAKDLRNLKGYYVELLKSDDEASRLEAWSDVVRRYSSVRLGRRMVIVAAKEDLRGLRGYFLELLKSKDRSTRAKSWHLALSLLREDIVKLDELKGLLGHLAELLPSEDEYERSIAIDILFGDRQLVTEEEDLKNIMGGVINSIRDPLIKLLKSKDEYARGDAWYVAAWLLSMDLLRPEDLKGLKDYLIKLLRSGNDEVIYKVLDVIDILEDRGVVTEEEVTKNLPRPWS